MEPTLLQKIACVAIVAAVAAASYGLTCLFPFLEDTWKYMFFTSSFLAITSVAMKAFGRLNEQDAPLVSCLGGIGVFFVVIALAGGAIASFM